MNDIQKARDVLAKWRDTERAGRPWHIQLHGGFATVRDDQNGEVAQSVLVDDAALIVGATDPELLDAIDLTLDSGSRYWAGNPVRQHAQRIAAAILAADNRMRS